MVLVSIMMLMMKVSTASAATNGNVSSTDDFDWTPVMEAIIQVESEGNPKAKSGNSVGVMQITPILVAECNDILKKRKSKKRYTLADRYSISKSKEMFLLMQSVHNPPMITQTSTYPQQHRSWKMLALGLFFLRVNTANGAASCLCQTTKKPKPKRATQTRMATTTSPYRMPSMMSPPWMIPRMTRSA